MKTFQVYVLVNRMNRRFIAKAESAEQELKLHNKGQFRGTSQFKPWKLEWTSAPMRLREADRLERKLLPHKTNPGALLNMLDEHTEDQEPNVFGVED